MYGLVVSVLIAGSSEFSRSPSTLGLSASTSFVQLLIIVAPGEPYSLFAGFIHLAAGLGELFSRYRVEAEHQHADSQVLPLVTLLVSSVMLCVVYSFLIEHADGSVFVRTYTNQGCSSPWF